MTEVLSPAVCDVCGFAEGDHDVYEGEHSFKRRLPDAYPKEWAPGAFHNPHATANKNEYKTDRIAHAARIMNMVHSAWEQRVEPRTPMPEQVAREIDTLGRILDGTLDKHHDYAAYELEALDIVNAIRIEASSSKARES